jgi:hypothetical protein
MKQFEIGDHVAWTSGLSGEIVAGPWLIEDGREFWTVLMDGSRIPTTITSGFLRYA